jgi:hypothetical protein
MSDFCGYVPFKDEWNWWQNFADIAITCIRCDGKFQTCDMDERGCLCRECRARVERASVVIVDEPGQGGYSPEVEAWLFRRGQ